jgi:hypothetical protein
MNIPTWQYKVEELVVTEPVDAAQLHRINAKLDELGKQGWEAVTNVVGGRPGHVFVLFKRQGAENFHAAA